MKKEEHPHKILLDKLNKKLDSSLVKVSSFYPQGIFLTSKNDFSIFISAAEDSFNEKEKRVSMSTSIAKVINDPNFRVLNAILNKETIKKSYDDASASLVPIIECFSKKVENPEALYFKLNDYRLKELVSARFNLSYNPSRELFLFGNDENRLRFPPYLSIEACSEGLDVEIIDSSAYIFGEGNKRSIDLISGVNSFLSGDRLYLGDITKMIPGTKDDHDLVSYQGDTKSYLKTVLKDGIDLSKERSIKCVPANRLTLSLFAEGSVMKFRDKEGEITIGHPDLLIYLT